ncbi:hypothetical protein IJ531_07050 [bacterium]|nr:hypothetical protein [bacterium]
MQEHIELLEKYNFQKQLTKLNKKLKDKRIIMYGAGSFLKTIKEHYDLSNLNIIGISDNKYQKDDEGKIDFDYKIIPSFKIKEYCPDYIIISALKYMDIMLNFKTNKLKGTKIKVLPLCDKPFLSLLKEIL